jgi:GDP-L-fucose synthase
MPTNLYGINDRYDAMQSHVIPAMIMKFTDAKRNNRKTVEIWGDGKPEREFLYSDDLAKAIHIILNKSKKKLFKLCNNTFPLINIGSGDIYTIKKLAELIQNKIGYKGKIVFNKKYPNGVMKKNLKFDKIRKLNWKPSIKLTEGLDLVLNSIKY